MKPISKTSVKGFCIILTEEKSKLGNVVGNVRFSRYTKEMLKLKKAYTSDVERENYDGIAILTRKIVFPLLTPEEFIAFLDEFYFTEFCNTIGSLTIEYGWLNALSCSVYDDYNRQNSNAYVSVIYDFEGFEDIPKESLCMQRNYKFQEEMETEMFDAIKQQDNEKITELAESKFVYDNLQLELF